MFIYELGTIYHPVEGEANFYPPHVVQIGCMCYLSVMCDLFGITPSTYG